MLQFPDRHTVASLVESIWIRWHARLTLISTALLFAMFALMLVSPFPYPWP